MRSCRAWLGGARGLASKAVFRAPHEGAERWGLNPGRLVLDVLYRSERPLTPVSYTHLTLPTILLV